MKHVFHGSKIDIFETLFDIVVHSSINSILVKYGYKRFFGLEHLFSAFLSFFFIKFKNKKQIKFTENKKIGIGRSINKYEH